MKLTIETTPEQDVALAFLNKKQNPNGDVPEFDFAMLFLNNTINDAIESHKQQVVSTLLANVHARFGKFSAEDIDAISAVANKYQH